MVAACSLTDCSLMPVTRSQSGDMHKTHNMSQHRVTIPFFVDDLEPIQVRVRRASLDSADTKFRFTKERDERRAVPINPWQLRDRFFLWPLEDWQRFFEISGEWDVGALDNFFSKDDFAEWQRLLRAALVREARDWKTLAHEFDGDKAIFLELPLPIVFEWDGKVPATRIVGQNALTSMIATIQIDKLQGAQFRVCARHDCKNPPFRLEARHKIYCSPECAHLVAVRKSRERLAGANNGKTRVASKSSPQQVTIGRRRGTEKAR